MNLRVAHIVCTDAFAGVERYITTLATGLAGRSCEVVVIGGDGNRMASDLLAGGASWVPGATLGEAVRQLLRHRDVDILHAHMTEAEMAALLVWPVVRAPIVATRHFAQHRGSSAPARLVGRLLTRKMAAQLAISRYVATCTEGKSLVVTPGTPAVEASSSPEEREPVVLLVQRLSPEKRTDLALTAWSRSGLGRHGWVLQIAGDGPERPRLEKLASELGVGDSCEFLGTRRDVDALQRRASIFLASRPDEPLGLSVIEAMAAGTPVVAAAGGGHFETVGRSDLAALYPPLDVDRAGELLVELADAPSRRARYGAELRDIHRQHFSVDRQVDQTLELYRSVAR